MPDMMYECEQRIWLVDRAEPDNQHKRTPSWKVNCVEKILGKTDVRCMHCYGAVRIHRKQKEDGIRDHVEHKNRADSENYQGGYYFKGVHKISSHPVA